jgi:hypothetical protein
LLILIFFFCFFFITLIFIRNFFKSRNDRCP